MSCRSWQEKDGFGPPAKVYLLYTLGEKGISRNQHVVLEGHSYLWIICPQDHYHIFVMLGFIYDFYTTKQRAKALVT